METLFIAISENVVHYEIEVGVYEKFAKCNIDFEFCVLSAARIVIGSNGQSLFVNSEWCIDFATSKFDVLHKLITMHDVFDGR